MKKIITSAIALILVLTCVFLAACGGGANVTKYDASKAKVYSVDLTSIDGYNLKVTNGTWAETYDKIIEFVKKETDPAKRYQLMHKAEDLLMSTGNIVPLYYYTDIYMASSKINGFFASPLGYKYFMYTTLSDGGNTLPVCLASEPASIDPALNSAVDGATLIIHLMSGLVKYDEDLELVADCAKELPTGTENADGTTTYVFELKDNLKWSNGEELKASDFEWAWKRAASQKLGADYGYMFDVIKGYGGDDVDGLAPLAVVADDAEKTISVTLAVDVPYFFELCAFPTYMPLYHAGDAIDDDGEWATKKETYVSNGAYTLSEWEHDVSITLVKNANYHDAENVTMPTVKFYLSDDEGTMLANYKKGDWLFIDSVPNEEIETLKKDYANEFYVGSQLGTYYVCFNNNVDFLPATEENKALNAEDRQNANTEIRKALSLLLDRDYICTAIGKAGQEPASSFVALGLTDASATDGKEFYQHAGDGLASIYGGTKDYIGYYDATKAANSKNANLALELLKKYFSYDESKKEFTNFPNFTYLYNTNSGHQTIGEYIQGVYKQYGITMKLENQEWATFLETRKAGNYTAARNGWLGDYNDPISFLDMWTSTSGNNDVQFGK